MELFDGDHGARGREDRPGFVPNDHRHAEERRRRHVPPLLVGDRDREGEERKQRLGLCRGPHLHRDGTGSREQCSQKRSHVRGRRGAGRSGRATHVAEEQDRDRGREHEVDPAHVVHRPAEGDERYLEIVKEGQPDPVDGKVTRVGQDGPRDHVMGVGSRVDVRAREHASPRSPRSQRGDGHGPSRTLRSPASLSSHAAHAIARGQPALSSSVAPSGRAVARDVVEVGAGFFRLRLDDVVRPAGRGRRGRPCPSA